MNKWILSFLILFLFSLKGQSQPGFNKVYQPVSTHANSFMDVISDNDTLISLSTIFDTLTNEWGIQLMKLDTFGTIILSAILSDTTTSYTRAAGGNKLIKLFDGGYAFCANYSGGEKVFFAKYNHQLEKEFIQYFPLDSDMTFQTAPIVKQLDNGDYLMYILYIPDDGGTLFNFAIKLLRLDENGDIKWEKKYMDVDTSMVIYKILNLDINSFLLVGSKGRYNSNTDMEWFHSYAFIIDSLGDEKWAWESSENEGGIYDVQETDDGGFILSTANIFIELNTWNQVMGIRKVDSLFHEEWSLFKDITPSQYAGYLDLQPTPDGNFVACGQLGFPYNSMPSIHMKISDTGEVIWERYDFAQYDGAQAYRHTVRGSTVLSSGSIVTCGSLDIDKPYGYSTKGWLMKISAEGCVDSVGCWPVAAREPFVKPIGIEVYPNPIFDELTVNLKEFYPKEAYIYFYDVVGRLLYSKSLELRDNQLIISSLPSGMVFYVIQVNHEIISRGKLIKN